MPRVNKRLLKDVDNFPEVKNYFEAIRSFARYLDDQLELFKSLDLFKPMLDQLNDIKPVVSQAEDYLQFYVQGEWTLDQLQFEFETNVSDYLQDQLDLPSNIKDILTSDTTPDVDEAFDDVFTLAERLYERIREKGYGLYHVLIGAA